jgi:hypothetical protein
VLVGRLGKSDHGGFCRDSFSVRHDRVGFLQWNTSVIFLKILEINPSK